MIKRAITCLLILACIFIFPEAVLDWLLRPAEILTGALMPYVPALNKEILDGVVTVLWVFFLIYFVLRFGLPIVRASLDRVERYGESSFLRHLEGIVVEFVLLIMVFFATAWMFDIVFKQTWAEREYDMSRAAAKLALPEATIAHRKATEDLRGTLTGLIPFFESTLRLTGSYHSSIPRIYSPRNDQYDDQPRPAGYSAPPPRVDFYEYRVDYFDAVVAGVNDYNMLEANKRPALSAKFPVGTTVDAIRSTYGKQYLQQAVTHLEFLAIDSGIVPSSYAHYKKRVLKSRPDLGWRATWKELFARSILFTIPLSLCFWAVGCVYFRYPLAGIYLYVSRFFTQGRAGSGGSSRFGRYFDEWEAAYRSSSLKELLRRFPLKRRISQKLSPEKAIRTDLFFGRSLYNPFLNIGAADDRHMMTIAGSRTGKGTTAIIPNLLLWGGSAIVIDPKGTNAAVTARARREMGQTVHIVDPFGLVAKTPEEQACFNPLAHLNPHSPTVREEISRIADALVVSDPGQKDRHWDDGARTVLIGAIAHLIGSGHYVEPTLPMLRDLLMTGGENTRTFGATEEADLAKEEEKQEQADYDSDGNGNELCHDDDPKSGEHSVDLEDPDSGEPRAGKSQKKKEAPDPLHVLWADMLTNHTCGGAAKETASRMIRTDGTNEQAGILSSADKHTEWLSFPSISHTLSKTSFTFSEIKHRPTTIYIILPPKLLKTYNRLLRLFINIAIGEMSAGGKAEVPVLMILDEFLSLGHMREVEEAFGLMAGYNLTIWPFIQELGQLRDLYGHSVNAFITNSRAVQVFGVFDESSTKFVSAQLGPKRSFFTSTSSEVVPLRTHAEVALDISRQSGRQYILRAGQPPLLLGRVPYYKGSVLGIKASDLFAGKYDIDPDFAVKSPLDSGKDIVADKVAGTASLPEEPDGRPSQPLLLPPPDSLTRATPQPSSEVSTEKQFALERPVPGNKSNTTPFPAARSGLLILSALLLLIGYFEAFERRTTLIGLWGLPRWNLDDAALAFLPLLGLLPAVLGFWPGVATRTLTLLLGVLMAVFGRMLFLEKDLKVGFYALIASQSVMFAIFRYDWINRRKR